MKAVLDRMAMFALNEETTFHNITGWSSMTYLLAASK